jgi:Fe-Mn family superoxide dismutase
MTPKNRSLPSRRDALKTFGAGMALAGLGAIAPRLDAAAPAPLGWDLPPLGFAPGALEPHFDAKTMEIHHGKHHQAYVTNAKNLLKDHASLMAKGPEAVIRDLGAVPESIRTGVRNNVGGHVNHAFFWKLITPDQGMSVMQLPVHIAEAFGSMDEFKRQFAAAALGRFGSGWAWLSMKDGKLLVHSTANQDSPLMEGARPILGLDVWEHAYYLHYQNRRADYVNAFWNVVNWTQAEVNFALAREA